MFEKTGGQFSAALFVVPADRLVQFGLGFLYVEAIFGD